MFVTGVQTCALPISSVAFHSVIYNSVSNMDLRVRSYRALGGRASHGCVRLLVSDAKWVYDNVHKGTVVTITESMPADPEKKASVSKPELNQRTMLPVETPQPTMEPIYISGAQPPLPLRAMRKNDSGTDVWWLQRKLTELGYYRGKCSGTYLDGTRAAVAAFQQACGLRASGEATLETLYYLYAAELAPVYTEAPQQPGPLPVPAEEPAAEAAAAPSEETAVPSEDIVIPAEETAAPEPTPAPGASGVIRP